MISVFIVFFVFHFLSILSTSFGAKEQDTGFIDNLAATSMILFIIAIIIPFALKRRKVLGGILLGMGIITLFTSLLLGVIGSVLLIAAGIAALRYVQKTTTNGATEKKDSAIDILRNRYAKGEITKDEFDSKRKDIE